MDFNSSDDEEVEEDDNVVIWTDGAVPRRKGERTATAAVFYAAGNPRNRRIQFPVTGLGSAARTELTAIVEAMEGDSRSVDIRSDCRRMVESYNTRMSRMRATIC